MEYWTDYTRFVITLIAVLDPFLAVPIFLTLTANSTTAQRHRTARVVSLTVFAVLMVSALIGETILQLLGASLASFRIGGGLVLLLMALAMLNAQAGNLRQTPEEANELDAHSPAGVVPIAVPLLAGPGAISMVIIAAQGANWRHLILLILCITAVCFTVWITLRLAVPIGQTMGTTGRNIATRLLGLLLAAISIETIAVGLKILFPALAGS